MTEIQLDVLWTLHEAPDNVPTLYVNFIPLYSTQALRDLFYGAYHPSLPIDELDPASPDLPERVKLLVQETRSLISAEPLMAGEIVLKERQVFHVNHAVTSSWNAKQRDVDDLHLSIERFIGNSGVPGTSRTIGLRKLSSASLQTVRILDGLSVEVAYRRHLVKLESLATSGYGPDLPPPKKAKVFISYRKPDVLVAKYLHGLFESYGNHSLFRPFLDEHNLIGGQWEKQLMETIDDCDAFVPIVTVDYAIAGSVSHQELLRALRRHRKGGYIISPVVFDQSTDAWIRLRRFDALIVKGDLIGESQDIGPFMRRVLVSAILCRT